MSYVHIESLYRCSENELFDAESVAKKLGLDFINYFFVKKNNKIYIGIPVRSI